LRFIEFLAGALSLGYLVAGVFFLRFWKKTRDRLFIHFAFAFWLLAMNQVLTSVLGTADERSGYAYVLRVLAFGLILIGIIDKNTPGSRDVRGSGEVRRQ
jgi:hypothetical protein